jgi:hypothetical protein
VPGRNDEPGFYYDASTRIYYREIPAGTVADDAVQIDRRAGIFRIEGTFRLTRFGMSLSQRVFR